MLEIVVAVKVQKFLHLQMLFTRQSQVRKLSSFHESINHDVKLKLIILISRVLEMQNVISFDVFALSEAVMEKH